jgi:hypothetical protein
LRVCKSLHELLGKRKVFTAWERLANDPLAEETKKLLEQLESRDSQLLLVKGFRRYEPGTDQREVLKTFMGGKKNIKLCTALLLAELNQRRTEDAEFLCGIGADKKYLRSYEKFENWRKERFQRQRQRHERRSRFRSEPI